MKTIIAGSRDLGTAEVEAAMKKCPHPVTEVVSGGCRGVDQAGEEWARLRGIPIKVFPADWKQFGKSAGFRRNAEMASYAEALVAVWDGKSPGTRNMIEVAKKAGLKVYVADIC